MHLLEISIFLLNNVIIRLTKNYEQPWLSVHNFGKSDYDIIHRKNAPFLYMHLWFHAQLAQKILDSFYMACMVSHAFLVAFIDKLYDM